MTYSDFKAFKGVFMTQKELKSLPNMLTPLELKRQKATKTLKQKLT